MKNDKIFSEYTCTDRLLHEPARTAIIALLYVIEEADFLFIRSSTGLSQGNLSSHLAKLEESGVVEIEKTFKGKKPHTVIRLSSEGREKFYSYASGIKKFFDSI